MPLKEHENHVCSEFRYKEVMFKYPDFDEPETMEVAICNVCGCMYCTEFIV